ncbi:MAG: PIG-L family deacetylase [Candidatus Dormiibacterota bacterium]
MAELFLLGAVVVLVVAGIAGFVLANDMEVPSHRLAMPLRTMAVFPHADDETVAAGGTLAVLARLGAPVALVILTRGELGTIDGQPRPGLAELRSAEARRAADLLGIDPLIQGGFSDGTLDAHRDEVSSWLASEIEAWRPDLVITYDLAGLYGHPDHVACAQILTELRATRFPTMKLWYSSLPLALVQVMVRFRAMPNDFPEASMRSRPTHKVFIGRRLRSKIRAWNAYSSQRDSLRSGAGKFIPSWLFLSILVFEYFSAAPEVVRPA